MTTGQENQLKGFDLIHKGKVRDIYRYKNNEILIITSDRISAFDFIFNDEIDGKGKILTSLTKYWFRQTKDIIKNHLIELRTLNSKRVLTPTKTPQINTNLNSIYISLY